MKSEEANNMLSIDSAQYGLDTVIKDSYSHNIPMINVRTMEVIQQLLKYEQPRSILEIGTGLGFSCMSMLCVTDNETVITTIEKNVKRVEYVRNHIKEYGIEEKVIVLCGDALSLMPELNLKFDFVLLDGVKSEYSAYMEILFDKIVTNGLLVADNVLLEKRHKSIGVDLPKYQNTYSGLKNFLGIIFDCHWSSVILDVGDGLSISRKV
jgi:predicted O-methyltransferase YrrM